MSSKETDKSFKESNVDFHWYCSHWLVNKCTCVGQKFLHTLPLVTQKQLRANKVVLSKVRTLCLASSGCPSLLIPQGYKDIFLSAFPVFLWNLQPTNMHLSSRSPLYIFSLPPSPRWWWGGSLSSLPLCPSPSLALLSVLRDSILC